MYAFGILGGSVYGAMGGAVHALVWMNTRDDVLICAIGGAVLGGGGGMVSLLWVMYCLVESNLWRSIPVVLGITAAGAIATGPLGPGLFATVPLINIGACVFAYRRFNSVKWRRRRNLCIVCEYDLRGLSMRRCPECGTLQGGAANTPNRITSADGGQVRPPERK